MSAHTPGPWRAAGNAVITADEKLQIAAVIPHGGTASMRELAAADLANAGLLAAAPALLSSLKTVVANGNKGFNTDADYFAAVEAIRAAENG